MQLMCIEAFYPKPKTTKRGKDHKVYPYLLNNLSINRINQVWCTDITYIPMKKGFIYLKAYDSMEEAKKEIGKYITFYNTIRPHQGLEKEHLIVFIMKKSAVK